MNSSNRISHVPSALTLVCLAHAGGSVAVYREWQALLPSFIKVRTLELPGHGMRRAEPVHTEWPALVEQLADELRTLVDDGAPFALFGHSMGSLVGLELMHALRERGKPAPVWFGASATISPSRRKHETHWLNCSHTEMIACLRERGGTPAELLDDADFVDFMLPLLRADFHLCGMHPARMKARLEAAGSPAAMLDCPIDVFVGRDDPATAHAADVDAWAQQTRGPCAVHRFEGGHFFIDTAREAVLAVVAGSLARRIGYTQLARQMPEVHKPHQPQQPLHMSQPHDSQCAGA
ncbi:thioesterase II family protein [Paraburkholderia phenoliruptrix]|uniref:thioesterase II family protein n=1 Tax=Paraburkholderia phenoliruptrix TaxID=252970 RepID=UPI001C6E31B3|nr:alpha/beta fold hydrolase [Paraburkholderia phenoliruptrix]MBW9107882.1 thioesterase [Paraburkholderia phenoliruptrix]MBW9133202.1 thioesterase [Paraburkholderia ginsengiterrae]